MPYVKTSWVSDDIVSAEKLNNIENGIEELNTRLAGQSIWVGTEAEYDALETKDENTLYFIKTDITQE